MRNKGFTLMELLIVMGLTTVISLFLVGIMINSTGVFYKESSTLQQGLNINDALSKILESIRQASSISNSYIDGTTTYTSGVTQLVLEIPSQDASKNIIANTFDHYVFFLDQTKLRLKTFPDAQSSRKAQDQIFSTMVDSLSFKYFDSATPSHEVSPTSASKVRITVTLKQKSGSSFQTSTASSEASLRND